METTQRRWPKVAGRCPSCHLESLFLAAGGHVTCGNLNCPDPDTMGVYEGRVDPPQPPRFKQGDTLPTGEVFVCYTEDGDPIWAEHVEPHSLCCDHCKRRVGNMDGIRHRISTLKLHLRMMAGVRPVDVRREDIDIVLGGLSEIEDAL